MISFNDIKKAQKITAPFVPITPLIPSNTFSRMAGCEVFLKTENLQKTGSFKVRGAFNKLTSLKGGKVIAASMGNHAQAVAYAATTLGLKCRIIMPETAPIVKEEATKGYGAEVILKGNSFKDAVKYAKSQKDYAFIHAFDDDKIIAGQGTIGLEISRQLSDADFVLVPVGGGGLISGISTALKALSPKTKVIGVQTKSASSAFFSFKKKHLVEKPPMATIADGIAIGKISQCTFNLINKFVDDLYLVDDDAIAMAIHLFLERKKLVVEGAGAAPLAALLENKKKFSGKKVILIVSGGNIDFLVIDRIIHKGLIKAGRIGLVSAILDDTPGSLNNLTKIIADLKGNIISVSHERLLSDLPLGRSKVKCSLEIRNKEHLQKIRDALISKGITVDN